MCCIIYRPVGAKEITTSNIEKIITKNPHGWGVSYINPQNNKLVKEISLNMKLALLKIRELEKQNIEFLFHARWATHGEKSLENCHPYEITNGVLFHNGKIKGKFWNNKMSDTWHYCKIVNRFISRKKQINWILNKTKRSLDDSRIAIMLKGGKVIFHGKWHKVDDCSYSKLNWQENNSYYYYYGDEDYHRPHHRYNNKTTISDNVRLTKDELNKFIRDCMVGSGYILNYDVNRIKENELIELMSKYPNKWAGYINRVLNVIG